MITLRDIDNDFVINKSDKVTVNVLFDKTKEHVYVKPIKGVGDGRYEASFTPIRCGYYVISIIVDGDHIPGSPYRYVRMCVQYVYVNVSNYTYAVKI